MAMHFSDKLSPFQPEGRKYFKSSEVEFAQRMYASICKYAGIKNPQDLFDLAQTDMFTIEEMGSTPVQHNFLQSLILASKSRNALEIGSFIGASSMYLASALKRNGGKLVTIEKFDKFGAVARTNFEKNKFDNIELIVGDAFELLRDWRGDKFDFVFLDGNKEKYGEYFLLLDKLLVPGGIIVVDDIFFNGDIFNEACSTDKGKGAKHLLEVIQGREDYHRSILPMSNGLVMLQKTGAK